MKRIGILSLIILLTKIISFSTNISNQDSTVLITSTQLKQTNLIFIEHKKLLEENSLLFKQLDNYKQLNDNLIQVDSVRLKQIDTLNKNHYNVITNLNEQLSSKDTTIKNWKIGCFTVSLGLILFVLFK